MGRFSLEFGRKGPEGLKEEHDEGLTGSTASEDEREDIDIKKILDDLDATTDDAFEDPKKDFLDEISKLMNDDEEIDEYYSDSESQKGLEEEQEEINILNETIKDIFG